MAERVEQTLYDQQGTAAAGRCRAHGCLKPPARFMTVIYETSMRLGPTYPTWSESGIS